MSSISQAYPDRVEVRGYDLTGELMGRVGFTEYFHLLLTGSEPDRLWRRFGCRVLTPLGNDTVMRRYDPEIPVETLDWGQSSRLSDRLTVHLEPSFHWSGRTPFDRRMALWGSWVLTDDNGGVLYHVGDTAYRDGRFFRHVRDAYGEPDVALIPIGAYEPRWYVGGQHVDPDGAVRILLDCGARQAFGHHWGTFRLTDEGIDDRSRRSPPRCRRRACRPSDSGRCDRARCGLPLVTAGLDRLSLPMEHRRDTSGRGRVYCRAGRRRCRCRRP